uniref:F-box/LRR-repeat protein 15/At3g58940/PEG3-like LRR domain-containing protein n=1 Tax=Brassica oleracea TaxID=3712 RepID=A0A3P6EMG8_BRAOL|nr:unnamed protein product [Brassica oleracea]
MMTEEAEDLISNLPVVIRQRILCFVPIELAIKTSLLSKRWRHANTLTADSINKTLARYTAPKMKSFHLLISPIKKNIPYIDTWIKFAMSRNVENLSLDVRRPYYEEYKLPDFFYNSSSFKQLNIKFTHKMVMECRYGSSWVSLQKLSLSFCSLSDESMAKILSGCPILEYLRLQIVAPHIHCLRLLDSMRSCTLVDVASLTEAKLDICYVPTNKPFFEFTKPGFLQLQVKVLEMLEKLQNAEKLTFGSNFIQILSLAEIRGVYFPMLKVKSLTLDTISQYVIPGIQRLLQNSPDLEKLVVGGRTSSKAIPHHLDQYLKSQSLKLDQCWRSSKDGFKWNTSCCCCVLSALLLSCADGASENKATSGNTPSAGGCGGAGCGGGCGD